MRGRGGRGRGGYHRGRHHENIDVADLLRPAKKAAEERVAQPETEEGTEHALHKAARMRSVMSAFVPIHFFLTHRQQYRTVEDDIHSVIHTALMSGVAKIHIELGHFLGTSNQQPVRLPLLSDAIISQDDVAVSSSAVEFRSALPYSHHSKLMKWIMTTFHSRNQTSSDSEKKMEMSMSDKSGTLSHFQEDWRHWQGAEAQDFRVYKETRLTSLLLYRCNASLQLRLISKSEAESVEAPREAPLAVERHQMQEIIFTEGDGLIEWSLKITIVDSGGSMADILDDSEADNVYVTFGFSDRCWDILRGINADLDESSRQGFEQLVRSLSILLLNNAKLVSQFELSDEEKGMSPSLYYPNLFGDNVSEVRRHYNQKKIGVARESAIEIVRRTNNQAKRLLIDDYVASGASVLDLACGHGQDLLKYANKDLKLFVGVDFSSEEIKEARQRCQGKQRWPQNAQIRSPAVRRFHVGNMLMPDSYKKFLKPDGRYFDTVSVQLAIHYTLNSEEDANLILASIAERLKPGGIFIGSCPSSFVIADRMRKSLRREIVNESTLRYTFGNSVYNVSFDSDTFERMRGCEDTEVEGVKLSEIPQLRVQLPGDPSLPANEWVEAKRQEYPDTVPIGFGHEDMLKHHLIDDDPLLFQLSERWGLKYTFWLVDHIDAAENLVPWRAFCRMARKHGLHCLMTAPFDQYCAAMCQRGHADAIQFAERMEQTCKDNPTAAEQTEVISFYQVFAFQKLLTQEDSAAKADSFALQPPALSSMARTQMTSADARGNVFPTTHRL